MPNKNTEALVYVRWNSKYAGVGLEDTIDIVSGNQQRKWSLAWFIEITWHVLENTFPNSFTYKLNMHMFYQPLHTYISIPIQIEGTEIDFLPSLTPDVSQYELFIQFDLPTLGIRDQNRSKCLNYWMILNVHDIQYISDWWFRTFCIFHNIWDNPSNWHWLIFFKMVKTNNQILTRSMYINLGKL